jgi:PAS domain S-box-containing protein
MASTGSGIKILLVEDNPGDVLLIEENLSETASINLINVDRLSTALDRLAGEYFDVVLLDLQLPDSSGLSTFLQVQMLVPLLPIVVMTGMADETLAVRAMQAGAQDYIIKGQLFANDLLLRSIRYAIERKRVAAALEKSERELRSLTENAPDIIVRFDRQLRHVFINQAIEPATGLPPEAFIGKTIREIEIMSLALIEQWEMMVRQVFDSGKQEFFEFEYMSPRGLVFYQAKTVPEFAANGLVESVLAIVRDVTEQRQLESRFLKT